MKSLTLISMLIFYGAYFIKGSLLKKDGISVNRLGRGMKKNYTRLLEKALIITTYSMAVLQLFSIFRIFPSIYIGQYNDIIGVTIAFIGNLFLIMALIAMKKSWRAGVDSSQRTRLQTGGVLKLSRNPAFLGFDLFYIGISVANPNIVLFITVIIALLLFHLQILEEEKFLAITFGDDYLDYKSKVRRYI
jgi:protein-S-isoprenylcysteine O-methyltransferase Ste14